MKVGSIACGRVVGRDNTDVFIELNDTGLVGKLSRPELACVLEGIDDLPDGSEVVTELLTWRREGLQLRLSLRDIEGNSFGRYRGLNEQCDGIFQKPPGAPFDPLRTRSGSIVSLDVISSRHIMPLSDVVTLYRAKIGPDVPRSNKPLDIESARRIVDILKHRVEVEPTANSGLCGPGVEVSLPQEPKLEFDPLRSRTGFVVSPQVLGARFGIERSSIEQAFRQVTGRECPK
ncbi:MULTISPECIES: hypothetical protein [Thiorhodovibrio]|uniref:hypothetical protein n=1 Tax=Thiorhodovibrio TaxID=61593 RepID=UPI0019131051|nr:MULTISPECIES: hypothetical protein [Thiorhodovibrio]WPL11045.1 hypothetical protein Thiosp_00771 [Thiorhodovibrio litoralis]